MKIAIALAIALALSSLAVMTVQSVMAALDKLPGASQFAPGNQFAHGTGEQPSAPYKFSIGHQFEHNSLPGEPYRPDDPNRNAPGTLYRNFSGISTGPG